MAESPLSPGTADRLQRLLKEEEDDAKIWLAVRRGLLTDEQINEALIELLSSKEDATQEVPRRLRDIVVTRGWLNETQLDALVDQERRSDFEARSRLARPPAEVEALLGDPAHQLAEFVLVEQLGQGGAAAVWRAWDRELRRWVAIKSPSVLMNSPERRERFRREAQAAARLTHPCIVPVHRVAENNGQPYIVMQLIEGRTLAELRLPREQALRVMETVARAVDYAHQQGVVHRDLKPGNMMLDRQGRTWIFDFGLAHLFEDDRKLTATGAITGTASYMPPEQARGDRNARLASADIYSLGATLYELVTGRPPFEGASFVEIIEKVSRTDPVPPCRIDRRLPKDVDTLILKAMDKDPARRYVTAAEMADDLHRLLDGEPIRARPTSLGYRIYRRARKNPVVTALSLAGAIALATAVGLFLRGFEQSRQIEAEKQRTAVEKTVALMTMREMARLSLDSALKFRKAGDTDRMRDFLPVLESAYAKAAARAELAEVDYLMGRMYRAIQDQVRALEFIERSLARDSQYAPALYERIVLLSEKHSADLRRAFAAQRESDDTGSVEAGAKNELFRLQEKILKDCSTLERLVPAKPSDGAPGITVANALAARGILAYHQGQFEEARRILSDVVRQDPQLEEAWSALGRALVGQSLRDRVIETRRTLWEEGYAIYSQALEHDRGYLPHLLGRSELVLIRGKSFYSEGRDPDPEFEAAESDLSRAVTLYPGRAETHLRRAIVRTSLGQSAADRGVDPSPILAGAEADFHEALKREPNSAETWMRRGMAWSASGQYRLNCGEDPLSDLAAAEEYLREALRIEPGRAEAWMRLGIVRYYRALVLKRQGKDPLSELRTAEEQLTKASELYPSYSKIWLRRAMVRIERARTDLSGGRDPEADLDLAMKDLDHGLSIDPGLEEAWMRKGVVEMIRGLRTPRSKEGSLSFFVPARRHFDRALELKKDYAEALIERGHLSFEEARTAAPGKATDRYQAALRDYAEATRINSTLEHDAAERIREAQRQTGSR